MWEHRGEERYSTSVWPGLPGSRGSTAPQLAFARPGPSSTVFLKRSRQTLSIFHRAHPNDHCHHGDETLCILTPPSPSPTQLFLPLSFSPSILLPSASLYVPQHPSHALSLSLSPSLHPYTQLFSPRALPSNGHQLTFIMGWHVTQCWPWPIPTSFRLIKTSKHWTFVSSEGLLICPLKAASYALLIKGIKHAIGIVCYRQMVLQWLSRSVTDQRDSVVKLCRPTQTK